MTKKYFFFLTLLLAMATGAHAAIGDIIEVPVSGYTMKFEVISDTEVMTKGGDNWNATCISQNVSGTVAIPQTVTNSADGRTYIVTKIDRMSFSGCIYMTEVIIPNSVKQICRCAFQSCDALTSVSFPESVIKLESQAFNNCEQLWQVSISKNLQEMEGAFSYTHITSVILDSANPYLTMRNNVLYQTIDGKKTLVLQLRANTITSVYVPSDVNRIGSYAFAASSLTECTLPKSLEEIGYMSFTHSNLSEIDIPESVTKIDYYAFEDCENLRKVILNGTNIPSGGAQFSGIPEDAVLTVPLNMKNNYNKKPYSNWFSTINTYVPIIEMYFPDQAFRTTLLENYDSGRDGRLMEEEIAEITVLDDYMNDIGIEDLTGIEYFTALTDLGFFLNQVKTADLSKNVNLTNIYSQTNQIMGEDMDFFVEHLPDVRPNHASLYVYDNTNGRPDGNEMTPEQVTAAKQKGWTVMVYDKNTRTWSETQGFRLIREKWFPDPAMRHYLNDIDFRCGRGGVTVEDAEDCSELDFGYETELTDLTGIDFFTGLESLAFTENKVKRADLSKLTKLWGIQCDRNQIQGTDMDYFINHLPYASGGSGEIAVYWGSNNNGVEGNEMTPEQVKKANQKGWKITVYDDIKQGFGYETAGFWLINEERFPDPVFRNEIDVNCRYWNDFRCKGALTMEDVEGIDEFGLESKGISDLTGIEYFTEMSSLLASVNHLTTIDLSQNKTLNHLECYINNIEGQGMDDLIASLPYRPASAPGDLLVYDDSSSQYPEHNVMTAEQVAAAKLKNWIPYKWDKNKWEWVEFLGNDVATGVDEALPLNANGQTNDEDGWYTLDGRKLDSTPAAKGVYVRNGKKVVVK